MYMLKTTHTHILATSIVVALFATPALAHETAEIHAHAETDVSVGTDMPVKPLEIIKARAKQLKEKAQNANTPRRADMEEKMETKASMGARPDPMMRERQASTTRPGNNLSAMIKMHGGVIKNRFRLAISHMENLLNRVDSRLDKMTAQGIDTASALALQGEATLAMNKAKADAQAVSAVVENTSDSSDRATVRAELQVKIKTAQESMRAAHVAVKKVVSALVSLSKNNKTKVDASAAATTSVQ